MKSNFQQRVSPRHRRSQSGNVSQSTVTIGFAIIALVSVMALGFLYLQQVFGTATHGSNIQSLEQQMISLKEKQKELELQGAKIRSIQSVEERVQKLNLVSASNVGYLAPRTGRVALDPTL